MCQLRMPVEMTILAVSRNEILRFQQTVQQLEFFLIGMAGDMDFR